MGIGERIKERRLSLGFTQTDLAQKIGVTKGAIGNYESGVSSPKVDLLIKLFDILQCDANYLYQDDINIKIKPAPENEGELDDDIIKMFNKFTPAEVQRLIDFAKGIEAVREDKSSEEA